nr:hypothetical protein A5881_003774 [Enterococcus termitis]
MLVNTLGFLANLTSLILWIPQARVTLKNRGNIQRLRGISIGTQVIVIINTLMWCIYGLLLSNLWLAMGTIIILPLAVMTIILKMKLINKEKMKGEEEIRRWFTFSAYKQLSKQEKVKCLEMIYSTEFGKQVNYEFLNWESYEQMDFVDKMYWDKDLWSKNKDTL